MNLLRNLWRYITPPKKPSEVPNGLKKLIDKCKLPASVSTYGTEVPLMIYANWQHEYLTEYSTDDIYGMSPMIFYKKDVPGNTRPQIIKELRRDSFWTGEVVNYTKSGKEMNLSMTIFGICYEGRRYYIALKSPVR